MKRVVRPHLNILLVFLLSMKPKLLQWTYKSLEIIGLHYLSQAMSSSPIYCGERSPCPLVSPAWSFFNLVQCKNIKQWRNYIFISFISFRKSKIFQLGYENIEIAVSCFGLNLSRPMPLTVPIVRVPLLFFWLYPHRNSCPAAIELYWWICLIFVLSLKCKKFQ